MFVLPLAYPASRRGFRTVWTGSARRSLDGALATDAPRWPAMDVTEIDAGDTLSFDWPGIAKDQVKVSIDGHDVRVEASSAAAAPEAPGSSDAARVAHHVRRLVRFARSVTLPCEIDPAISKARFENGLLTLTLAKKQPEGATLLTVQ
jgi:HSP20 family protein